MLVVNKMDLPGAKDKYDEIKDKLRNLPGKPYSFDFNHLVKDHIINYITVIYS